MPEAGVGDELNVGLLGVGLLDALLEVALVDEVATKGSLGVGAGADDGGGTEGLDAVLGPLGVVEVLGLETALIAGARDVGLARLTGVNVDGVVLGLHIEANLLALVLAGVGGDLGGVEGSNLVGNDLGGLDAEVDIIDAELLVEPAGLLVDEGLGDPAIAEDDTADWREILSAGFGLVWEKGGMRQLTSLHLLNLASKFGGDIADGGRAKLAVTIAVVRGNVGGLRRRQTARVLRGNVGQDLVA